VKQPTAAFAIVLVLALAGAFALLYPRFGAPEPEPAAPVPTPAPAPTAEPLASAPEPAPTPSAEPSAAKPPEETELACPAGMVLVDGIFCPMVVHTCEVYVGVRPKKPGPKDRCERFADKLWCEGRPSRLHFCIDRFEYPNLPGARPAVMASYRDAQRACAAEGKRICADDEWSLACEGARTWPYAASRVRDPGACNLDRRPRSADRAALATPFEVSAEVERLDQRVPSGALPGCVSPYGVADMNGNVAEWVFYRHGERHVAPRTTALAGGDWQRSPATCRSLDAEHGPDHRSYATGFRCCAAALDGKRGRELTPGGFRLPRHRRLSK
jgi:formylglycine-generating enzyme